MRSHSRASSRGSDFYDAAVSFHQDDGSFADRSEEDEVMEMPRRARRHSLSTLDSLQSKCYLQFEEPFCESKLVADSNMEQLLTQLQEHRPTLDAVNIELFKKVHSTGIYFMSIDVQVYFSPSPSSVAFFVSNSSDAFLRTDLASLPACSKYLLWPKAYPRFLPDGQLSFCQVCYCIARCLPHTDHILRMHRPRLLP
jgi:hypothetical protein